ncbi:hypothetical protein ABZV14_18925 [Streptosporangium canum]|uniref:hypothetical protein n=1 Tax=Streptosporangium canum TaxID=324952 RepID=UPI0033B224A8
MPTIAQRDGSGGGRRDIRAREAVEAACRAQRPGRCYPVALYADTALAALRPPEGMLVLRRPNGTLPDGGSGYA